MARKPTCSASWLAVAASGCAPPRPCRRLAGSCPAHQFHHQERPTIADDFLAHAGRSRAAHIIVHIKARADDRAVAHPATQSSTPCPKWCRRLKDCHAHRLPACRSCRDCPRRPACPNLSLGHSFSLRYWPPACSLRSSARPATPSCDSGVSSSSFLNPCSTANWVAPSPTSITCGVFSITARATEIGWAIYSIAATAPALPCSSMIEASKVTCAVAVGIAGAAHRMVFQIRFRNFHARFHRVQRAAALGQDRPGRFVGGDAEGPGRNHAGKLHLDSGVARRC